MAEHFTHNEKVGCSIQPPASLIKDDIISAFDEILDYVYGRSRGRDYPSKFDYKVAQEWIDEGVTLPIACCVFYIRMSIMHERWLRQKDVHDKTNIPQHLGLFDENIRLAITRIKSGGGPIAIWEQSESQWRARIKGFYSNNIWLSDMWGPRPGEEGCRVPLRFMKEKKK